MSQQIDLLGIASYQKTRRPVKGRHVAMQQIELFQQREQAKPVARQQFKKGQRFFIPQTARIVKYIGRFGGYTLWESAGDVYRITWEQVQAVSLEPLH